jgi:hypothetical protein
MENLNMYEIVENQMTLIKFTHRLTLFGIFVFLTYAVTQNQSNAQERNDYKSQMMKHHGSGGGHHMRHTHDEVNMPGLQGKDTTEEEVSDLKDIFRNHRDITRTVKNLPNGIRTITETKKDNLRDAVVRHVVGMVDRLEEKKDPKIIIQSPTLDVLFKGSHAIKTEINMTDLGVEVIQTSADPILVKALQKHAAEVTDMVKRGMRAVHESTSRQRH